MQSFETNLLEGNRVAGDLPKIPFNVSVQNEKAVSTDFAGDVANKNMSVLKGPLTDYLYVVREDFYKGGEPVVKEGKHGKWIWTVYEGVVRITKGPITLARLGQGCFIGTIRALMYGEYERNATVVAEDDVRLCLLDVEPYYREYSRLSPDFRRLLLSLDQRLRKLNTRVIEQCSEDSKIIKDLYRKGKPGHNDFGGSLYRITEGNAGIIIKNSENKDITFSLGKDDLIGNIPFVDFKHEPHSAEIIASKDLKTEKINMNEIQMEYENLSKTFKSIVFNIGNYIRNTTSLVKQLHINN